MKFVKFLLVCALFALWILAGCAEPIQVDEPGVCDGNHAPKIRNLTWVVEHWADQYGFMIAEPQGDEDAIFLSKKDRVVLWFEFTDQDCNLNGGQIYWSIDTDRFVPIATIELPTQPTDLSCDGMLFTRFADREVEGDAPEYEEDIALLPRGYGYYVPEIKLQNLSCGLHEVTLGVRDECDTVSTGALTAKFFIPAAECF